MCVNERPDSLVQFGQGRGRARLGRSERQWAVRAGLGPSWLVLRPRVVCQFRPSMGQAPQPSTTLSQSPVPISLARCAVPARLGPCRAGRLQRQPVWFAEGTSKKKKQSKSFQDV